MRILQLTAFYLPSQGGIQYYVRNLCRELSRQGHALDIVTINTERTVQREEHPEGNVYRCALDYSYHRGLISRELIRTLFRRRDYDILHVHIPFPLGLEVAVLAGWRNGIPVVVTHHGSGKKSDRLYTLIASAYDMVYRHASLRGVARTIFLTESYRDEVVLPSSIRATTRIVRTGADIESFRPDIDGAAIRRQHGLSTDDTVGLWVGSLNEHNRYKGVNYLLDALGCDPAARMKLLVVGVGSLQQELIAQAARLGIGDRVRFTGPVENSALPGYYAASDFFVLPSIQGPENSPVVVFEAMASGKPVIATDIAGVREIVEERATGLLVPPRDVPALAAALGTLIVNSGLRGELGRKSREKAEHHSWERCALQTAAIYHEAKGTPDGNLLDRRLFRKAR
jgi:glycosyltransferase involved in cell wall biosynthesis